MLPPNLTSQKVAIPAALFLSLSPGVLLTTAGKNVKFANRKTSQSAVFFHALVFFLVYSLIAKAMGLVLTKTDLLVTTALFIALSPGLLLTLPPGSGGVLPVGSDQHLCGADPHDCVCGGVCAFASPISSVLLSKRMKYLVLGPASMGIFTLIGALKARETALAGVQEISGASAGAILALFLAMGMSVDEILEKSISLNIPNFVKIRIGSFFNKFGFVDMGPIRKKLVDICGSDPTFEELDMKIYVSAYCLNTSETVYFSRDTHPHMKVIDAVCMSMAVPFIFACGNYDGRTYVDGGTKEDYPLTPFMDKKPHEITCIRIKMDTIYKETIDTPKQFVETLVRSALTNRTTYNTPIQMVEINVKDTDIFDFNMDYEEKVRLFNLGYTFLSA
jgi:predicted acylesterase/phospholipase RssA